MLLVQLDTCSSIRVTAETDSSFRLCFCQIPVGRQWEDFQRKTDRKVMVFVAGVCLWEREKILNEWIERLVAWFLNRQGFSSLFLAFALR